jgi:hypothetical protein
MNPSSDPRDAIKQGYYVEPPDGGVWSKLTRALELEPASTHLVLGGIGSGKTSELLRACATLRKSLRETGDFVRYCDVSRYHDLGAKPEVGVLFALTAKLLVKAAKKNRESGPKDAAVESAIGTLTKFAEDSFVWVPYEPPDWDDEPPERDDEPSDYEPGSWVRRVGVLKPPPPDKPINFRLGGHRGALETVLQHYPGKGRAAIMLFDSLDRLPQAGAFQQLIEDDIRVLKSVGVGVVLVGPVRFVAGHDRSLADLFDRVHFQLSTDPETDSGEAFLCEVLRRRTKGSELLQEDCFSLLAHNSGGVLRDLISLAKRSAEEAYATGHPKITADDVERASDAFGRGLAIGLDDEQLKILEVVSETGGFVVRGERELSLLETRRVLLYPDNHWAVHPTLRGLLDGIPKVQG